MAKGPRQPGEFCWINVMTPEPAQARAFFAQLFGWTYVEVPGTGHIAHVAGSPIGGVFDLVTSPVPAGTPPHIGVLVHVADADATSARVQALGGGGRPPFDVGGQGRMAVCVDPTGAHFNLWQPRRGGSTDVDTTLHGAPSWFEEISTDIGRATAFYTALFGWTADAMAMPEFTYTVFKQGNEFVAGLMPVLPDMGNPPSHWGVYFTVRDCDAAAREATALGATLCVPPRDIPNVGRFCGIVSPQGVVFYAITYAA